MDNSSSENLSEKCVKWEDVDGVSNCVLVFVSIDEFQHFIHWKITNGPFEYIEITSIRDIRISNYAKVPKDRKILDLCCALSDEYDDLTERCISICTGTDFINLMWFHFVCKTKNFSTKVYDVILNQIRLSKFRNPCHLIHLQKIWNKLHLEIQDQNDFSTFSKFFSQNKDDREKICDTVNNMGIKSQILSKSEFTFILFLEFYEKLFLQDMLKHIFGKVASEESYSRKQLNSTEFAKFINEFQRDKRLNEILYPFMSSEKAKEVISKYEVNPEISKEGIISLRGFWNYIFGDDNSVIDHSSYDLTQDMSQPLNHYFVNSSHNTYLTGHQLTGKSSAEIYRQVLLSGVRCIELDIWDGKGMEDEPIVTHGFTMCTAVPLRDVIEAIDESAFKTSEYPVILSFENHCTSKQLPTLVSIVQEKLSSKILKEPLETNPLEAGILLPSPEKLKGKILIKNKKKINVTDMDSSNEPNDQNDEDKSAEVIVPQISSMVNYVEPTSFESFEKATIKNFSFECCSFGELFGIQILNENPKDFVSFNKRQFSRIYPKGTRVDSSNFLPQLFWNAGCQLVALNFQTLDLGMQLNMGLFEFENRCGYILKPNEMRSSDREFDPFLESGVDGVVANSLKIMILSGHFISDKALYCYVELEMFGLPADTVRKRHKVKSTTKTGLNPQFPKSVILFQKIIHPQLALLRIIVSVEGAKFIGQAWIPVSKIRPGFRLITLKNESGQNLMMPSLLIHIEIEDFVPSDMEDFAMALSNPIAFMTEKERRAQQIELLTEEFCDIPEKINSLDGDECIKAKINTKSVADENDQSKNICNDKTSETLFSQKKRQTMKLKQSFKKKSSLKRGKSTRGILNSEEIATFLNQSILTDNALSDIDLEKMKSYKTCAKINEKREYLLSALMKKYEKKKLLLLSKNDTKEENLKEAKSFKKSMKHKSTSISDVDKSSSDIDGKTDEEIPEKTSQLDKKQRDILTNINTSYESELNGINLKYMNLFYDELHSSLESEVNRYKQRIEKIYRKESDVLKSLQHYKFKCETKVLQRECGNKDEFNRLKREALQKHIQLSVSELQKLTDLKTKRLNDLNDKIAVASENFKNEKEKDIKS